MAKVCVKCGKSEHTSVWYFCKHCQVFICGVCALASWLCPSCLSNKNLIKT
jgi:hypothetical protein